MANRAVAVVRLMDGQLRNWAEFLEPDVADYEALPRRTLKAGNYDVKKRVAKDIDRFCKSNFVGMTEQKLSELYEDIKSVRGLEMPLATFQERYARIKPSSLSGNPLHSTVHISLWGLQFEFPEKYLADDIVVALQMSIKVNKALAAWLKQSHRALIIGKPTIARLHRELKFYSRMAVLSCFNLVEAYFNSLAWEFLQAPGSRSGISPADKKCLEDTSQVSLSKKILKYHEIIVGRQIFFRDQDPFKSFIQIVKPYRDSLVHPSPFLAPEKFGGYDKLRVLYRIDVDTALLAAHATTQLIGQSHRNVARPDEPYPVWLQELVELLAAIRGSADHGGQRNDDSLGF